MTDVHTKEVRSFNMSQIKSKDTKPEILVRRYLFSKGLRYRLHYKKLPGNPDIVFPQLKTAIFIHGCYWHGHEGCKYFVPPKTNTEWWMDKINENKIRDERNLKKLEEYSWKVIIIWECELKPNKQEKTLRALIKRLKKNE